MKIRGIITVPPDKSISHRAIIFSSIADKSSHIYNLLEGDDVIRTLSIMESCGIRFEGDFKHLQVHPTTIKEPLQPLYCGNSGTSARLLAGLFSSQKGLFVLYGDESLSRRPMRRVTEPLLQMGANVLGRNKGENLPIAIMGKKLKGIEYSSHIASAQVKSAVILASLFASSPTTYTEPLKSRDHTERMLTHMGIKIKVKGNTIKIFPGKPSATEFFIPGDFSSAAFFITLGVIHPDAELTVKDIGLNPTRTQFLHTLQKMGANIELIPKGSDIEPHGDIKVYSSQLKGVEITSSEVPRMIDELPLIALLGVFANGITAVRGAKELRYKESDRISSTVSELKKMGAEIQELPDGFVVKGTGRLHLSELNSHKDHRIAMMLAIASLCTEEGKIPTIQGEEWVKISYPNFFETLKGVVK